MLGAPKTLTISASVVQPSVMLFFAMPGVSLEQPSFWSQLSPQPSFWEQQQPESAAMRTREMRTRQDMKNPSLKSWHGPHKDENQIADEVSKRRFKDCKQKADNYSFFLKNMLAPSMAAPPNDARSV